MLNLLQDDLSTNHPELDIHIIGINEEGFSSANGQITSEVDIADPGPDGTEGTADDVVSTRDVPWLQDVDEDENQLSDVWEESWQVAYRDVIVLDGANEWFGVFNLTDNSLADPANYQILRQMLIDAAAAR
ncbi:MAG TPA: hypothetical protein DIU15_08495 [Deltaproteobacteria bacterium]|nr:hypothetical protein [Deltaproteobacteria bacterium]HCP46065.1 hypothetical protein [Deltaproteobacteria bacterium]